MSVEALARGAQISMTLTRPAFGGTVVGRLADGRIIFVEGGAPGDEAVVEITRLKRRFAWGRVIEITTPGAGRATPFCPLVDRCGGCPWQQIQPAEQRQALADHVARLIQGVYPEAPMQAIWGEGDGQGWRATARLRWDRGQIGFFARGSEALVPVERCPVLTEEAQATLDEIRAHLAPTLRGRGSLRITAARGAASGTVALSPDPPTTGQINGLKPTLEAFVAEAERCHGATITGRWGQQLWATGQVDNLMWPGAVPHPAGAFVQAHRAGNAALVEAAVAACLEGLAPGEQIVELFAGSGNFTFALAEAGCRVQAVEHDGAAARRLADSVKGRGLEAQVQLHLGDANAFAGPLDGGGCGVVLLDPPRAGAPGLKATLDALSPRRVIYVSCEPASLARDLKAIGPGWRPIFARPFDLFPHTGHVETLIAIERVPS